MVPDPALKSDIHLLESAEPAVRQRWLELMSAQGLNASLGPEWIAIAAASIGQSAARVCVFVDREPDGTVRGVVPFFMSERRMMGLQMRVLQLASNLVAYHADVVAADASLLLRRFLGAAPRWDVFHAAHLESAGRMASVMRDIAADTGAVLQVMPSDVSPFLPIDAPWQAYLASKNKKFRYKLRHRRETLAQQAGSALVWYESSADVPSLLESMVAVEARSWKAGAGLDIPSRPVELEYYRMLLPWLAERGMLLASVLYVERKPIAYCLCCRSDRWIGNLKTSFDHGCAHLSPGSIVIDSAVERAFQLGAREFDFLGQAAPHKLAWTSQTRAHGDFFLFAPRFKPRLIGSLKLLKERLRGAPRQQSLPEVSAQ